MLKTYYAVLRANITELLEALGTTLERNGKRIAVADLEERNLQEVFDMLDEAYGIRLRNDSLPDSETIHQCDRVRAVR